MKEPRQIVLDSMGLPDLQSLRYAHWAKRAAHDKIWKQKIKWLAMAEMLRVHKKIAPFRFAHAEFVRFSDKEPDHDNLASSFKSVQDGLKGTVIVDDSPEHLEAVYRWEKTDRGMGRIRITVTEREQDEHV